MKPYCSKFDSGLIDAGGAARRLKDGVPPAFVELLIGELKRRYVFAEYRQKRREQVAGVRSAAVEVRSRFVIAREAMLEHTSRTWHVTTTVHLKYIPY